MAAMRGLAIVVGYGAGVSGAVAAALAERGYSLALIARDKVKLEAAVKALTANGWRARDFAADAADSAALSNAIAEAENVFGPTEILLYNAAYWRPGPVLSATPENFEADFRINVSGALVAARAVAPGMMARKQGVILFTGGGFAMYPSPNAPSLSIGKAGIRALALMLAEELAPKGVRVGTVTIMGTVAPGTPFSPDKIAEAFLSLIGTPPDPKTAEIVFKPS